MPATSSVAIVLALTLLGSYLSDAYNGDIRCREEVSKRLADDVRQGAHARKVMESYQTWFGEGPELSVLRMLGSIRSPGRGKGAFEALVKPPPIRGLTESLTNLSQASGERLLPGYEEQDSLPAKIRTIPGNWIRILSFVNTLANSCGVNKPMLGRNAIGDSIITIERLHRSCRITSGRWSRFSWQSSAAAMPVYVAKHCMKFTFRGFSEEMPPSPLTSSEPERHCSRF